MNKYTMEDILKMQKTADLKLDVKLEELDPDVDFKEQGMDSLDRSSFLFEIESYFDVEIPDEELANDEWSSITKILGKLNK